MVNIQVILAAVDLSDLSPSVIAYASSLALAWHARLLCVHVVHDLSYFVGMYQIDTSLDTLQQRLTTEAHERLQAYCQRQIGEQVPYDTLVAVGRPMAVIHQLVRDHAVDCLVLGTHSTDKPEHQLFGSTAERLIQYVPCPIFLVPPSRTAELITRG